LLFIKPAKIFVAPNVFGRKSEQFISSDPAQLKLDFEGVEQLKEAREYAACGRSIPYDG
jgi:hypothetical protein